MNNVKLWLNQTEIEKSAIEQIKTIASHPFVHDHISIMPDVHAGMGVPIGSVIPLKGAIMPAAVGVDIGCGMRAVPTSLKLKDIEKHLSKIDDLIREKIPLGFSRRNQEQTKEAKSFARHTSSDLLESINLLSIRYSDNNIVSQLGTLGGGNHFIELQVDSKDRIWIMVHSGSRNIGHKVASRYIALAKEKRNNVETELPEQMDILMLGWKETNTYLLEMAMCMDFAHKSRALMVNDVEDVLTIVCGAPVSRIDTEIDIHHNYAALEFHYGESVWVHRKGATLAAKGHLGIIPGSMGTCSYIVEGKGNMESFNSCSHGAGRKMSRTKAKGKYNRKTGEQKTKGQLTLEDFKKDMTGVYTQNLDKEHIDEAPRAYKNIDTVMENQKDIIDIKVKLTPILNIKG